MTRIHNVETNEIIDREMTDEEFAAHQAMEQSLAQVKAELEAKEALRQSRREKLLALGLTEEELDA